MNLGTMLFILQRTISTIKDRLLQTKINLLFSFKVRIGPKDTQNQNKLPIIFLLKSQKHVIYNVRSNIDNGFLGEVTEWLKVPTWNVGLVVTLTRVRIPLSPVPYGK